MKGKSKPSTIALRDFQVRAEQERKHLLSRYKNKDDILSELREVPVDARTYEMLGKLFFHAATGDGESDPPTQEALVELKNLREDVYLLFELARAAKVV